MTTDAGEHRDYDIVEQEAEERTADYAVTDDEQTGVARTIKQDLALNLSFRGAE
jgi:hypothetical protein